MHKKKTELFQLSIFILETENDHSEFYDFNLKTNFKLVKTSCGINRELSSEKGYSMRYAVEGSVDSTGWSIKSLDTISHSVLI